MGEENSIKPQVEEVIAKFINDYLQTTPKSVSIDIHASDIIATLHGIIPPVEKDLANSDPEGRDLLEKCYSDTFDVSKGTVEQELGNILGRAIENSMLKIDPRSSNAVMIFNLANRLS